MYATRFELLFNIISVLLYREVVFPLKFGIDHVGIFNQGSHKHSIILSQYDIFRQFYIHLCTNWKRFKIMLSELWAKLAKVWLYMEQLALLKKEKNLIYFHICIESRNKIFLKTEQNTISWKTCIEIRNFYYFDDLDHFWTKKFLCFPPPFNFLPLYFFWNLW